MCGRAMNMFNALNYLHCVRLLKAWVCDYLSSRFVDVWACVVCVIVAGCMLTVHQ